MYDSPGCLQVARYMLPGMIDLAPFLPDFPWLAGLPRLDASTFTWELNERDNSWLLADASGGFSLPSGWIPMGWCDAGQLRVRPRSGQLAVMFQEDGREFWQHIQVM
jgi:hypothetical protein